jgi:DNA repair exonuclease SbcCD nuclease subunit
MDKITTNELAIFTDIHYGLRSDSEVRLKIADDFIYNTFIPHVVDNGIKYVVFGGDLFHNRNSVNVNTMNHVIDAITDIAKHAKVYIIIGNHDLYKKDSVVINSTRSIESIENVEVVGKPKLLNINGKDVLLCPWLSDLSEYGKESVDMMIGHFDISTKYLIATYIEEQKIKAFDSSDDLVDQLLNNGVVSARELQEAGDEGIKTFTEAKRKQTPAKFLGSYVDVCKKGGQIFSGHIHPHRKFVTKGRNFTFISSPFENDWGDINKEFGFYNLNMHTEEYTFIENTSAPHHIEIRMSEINEDYDFTKVNGNFVRLFIDCAIEYSDMNDTIRSINENQPLEPCDIEYQHKINFGDVEVSDIQTLETGDFSKSTYVTDYINKIDDSALSEFNIDRTILKTRAIEFFNKAEQKLRMK